jgi:hypothetical protein
VSAQFSRLTRTSERQMERRNQMLKYALALGVVGVVSVSTGSQEPACPADAQRRQTAVQFARQLNTAQATFRAQNKRYGQIADLAVGAAPQGFRAQITTDGTTYSVAVKDTVDACHFALFSDDQGVIYTARPLR